MSGFPTLIPAFTAQLAINAGLSVGSPRNTGLTVVTINTGTIVSEPGYAHPLNAVIQHGSDYIRADTDGKHLRLDVDTFAKDNATGALVKMSYTGTLKMGGQAEKVLSGAPDAKTTDFGEVATHVTFETGGGPLAELANKEFVGSGRFILDDKGVTVEYKVSEVKP